MLAFFFFFFLTCSSREVGGPASLLLGVLNYTCLPQPPQIPFWLGELGKSTLWTAPRVTFTDTTGVEGGLDHC